MYKLFILRSNYFFLLLILDFAEQFSTYAFNTCLAHSAVVNTLDNVHRECLGMLSLRGLVTTSKRPMKIDEFSSMQDHAIKTFARRLNEWSEKTAMLMKEGLVRISKFKNWKFSKWCTILVVIIVKIIFINSFLF